jgi:coenzyme F420-0:L-glutamate ligase/coenzyme F420-1:gamma-L-glutamate ligase
MNIVQVIPVEGIPILKKCANLTAQICSAVSKKGMFIQDGDILVVTHAIVSVSEGRIVNLDDVVPSEFAKTFAQMFGKDPAMVEVVLRESKRIVRMGDGKMITETKHGFVCANSGVDKSNVEGKRNVALLPIDPDRSARNIRREIRKMTGCDVAVIISDTHGRPLREGEINVALGVAGITPIRDRRGEKDLFGYVLHVKRTAVADELASAAELVIGQASEGIPVAIIRGYNYRKAQKVTAADLIRPAEDDMFI